MTTNDTTLLFANGIRTGDFDLIPPGQDLYVSDFNGGQLMKVAAHNFTNYVGQLLITEEGFFGGLIHPGRFYALRWDAAATNFAVRNILNYTGAVEHVTFAPVGLPPLAREKTSGNPLVLRSGRRDRTGVQTARRFGRIGEAEKIGFIQTPFVASK